MSAPPYSGMQVGSSVVLKRQLSQGGMGSIWVGEHRGLQIDVAVKFLSAELARDEGAGERFKREAAAAARVKSPHVVSVFDQGVTDDGLPFIVMELLEGEDLGKRIARFGPRPLSEVVAIVNQLARALGTAHAQGIVHRDIKPDNVFLIEADGELFVKLLDFGIAKRATDDALNVTKTGVMMGTPYFMSPEQVLSAKAVDARADVWSLGVVVYVALTGRVPFEGETLGAVCCAIVAGELEPVTRRRRDLPRALDGWFDHALHRDVDARFESVRDMAAALELAAGVSPSGVSPSGAERQTPSFERSRRASPRTNEAEPADGGAFAASPHPTKFEATVGVLPKVRRTSHLFTMAASVLTVLAFGSVVGATLFLPPEQFEELKTSVLQAVGKTPNASVHSSSPEWSEQPVEKEPAPQLNEDPRPSVSPSVDPETSASAKKPMAPASRRPAAVGAPTSKPSEQPAEGPPRRQQRDETPSPPPAVVTAPPPPPSEEPPAPAPETDSPYGLEDPSEEREPGPYDEPDYGF